MNKTLLPHSLMLYPCLWPLVQLLPTNLQATQQAFINPPMALAARPNLPKRSCGAAGSKAGEAQMRRGQMRCDRKKTHKHTKASKAKAKSAEAQMRRSANAVLNNPTPSNQAAFFSKMRLFNGKQRFLTSTSFFVPSEPGKNMIQHAGLGYRRDLAEDFLSLSENSPICFIEAAPENWLKMGGWARKQFDRVAERLPLALHGLSMSLGGQAPLDTDLIDGIKEMMRRYDCTFFSDHLSYCHDGGHLYDLLPLPFTEEMVHHTARRIREVQDRLGCRIAVENTSYYLHSRLPR